MSDKEYSKGNNISQTSGDSDIFVNIKTANFP